MRSATLSIARPCRRANRWSSGRRDIVPSGFITSQMTPAGKRPASRARSTEPSVWPVRTSTPPSRARSGKTWPGRTRSPGLALGATAAWMVRARSAAEMPVVTPRAASMETVNAVPNGEVLSWTIKGSASWRMRSSVSDRQMRPRPCMAMKLMAVGRHLLGGHDQVALVLAVLVVGEDDHPAPADVGHGPLDQGDASHLFQSSCHQSVPKPANRSMSTVRPPDFAGAWAAWSRATYLPMTSASTL